MSKLRLFDPFSKDPFEDLLKGFFLRPVRMPDMPESPQMKLEVSEDDKQFVVKAEMPGIRKEDIDVRIEGDMVRIHGELKKEREEKKEGKTLLSERYYGSIDRSFSLGSEVDQGRANAKFDNGVLELTLPKRPGGEVKRLAIQ
jgi:HSP20 family protein